ncbi:MAG: prepilin-type N-terminal cleavage/methylation domain-containing protein [Candidatus Doudnabacteria bacterium]|nr:prepilin-type N-terminal cleavage/methylation domain-containing protein [Candidatus Doudnabacteria bacterium]
MKYLSAQLGFTPHQNVIRPRRINSGINGLKNSKYVAPIPLATLHRSNSAGFTLIELLVVIAIIGLLASIITTAMNNARLKARDARRLTDISQIKTGMDLYFSHGGGYPSDATYDAAYTAGQLLCSTIPIMKIPQDPLYPTFQYDYNTAGLQASGCGLADLRLEYTLTFRLERDTSILYSMDEDGQITPPLPGN